MMAAALVVSSESKLETRMAEQWESSKVAVTVAEMVVAMDAHSVATMEAMLVAV